MVSEEDKLVKKVTAFLKGWLAKDPALSKRMKIAHHIGIFKDATVIENERTHEFELVLGEAQQDIVLYRNDDNSKFCVDIPLGQDRLKKAVRSFSGNSRILVPVSIFEVKYGDVQSHQVQTYSFIAQQIKDKFPGVFYYLVLVSKPQSYSKRYETLERQGKHFTAIIPLLTSDPKQIAREIWSRMREVTKGPGK